MRARMIHAVQSRAATHVETMLIKLELAELRRSWDRTQVDVMQAMNKEQASVSKLERRDDMYIGTLQAYVQALGGELKLIASFPDADIQSWPERKSRS